MTAGYWRGAGRIVGGTVTQNHRVNVTHTPPSNESKPPFHCTHTPADNRSKPGAKFRVQFNLALTGRGVESPCTSNDSPTSHDRSARAIRSRKCFSPSLFAALGSSVIDPFLKDGDSFLHGDNTIEASCDALTVPLDHDDRSGHRHPYCSGHLYAF